MLPIRSWLNAILSKHAVQPGPVGDWTPKPTLTGRAPIFGSANQRRKRQWRPSSEK